MYYLWRRCVDKHRFIDLNSKYLENLEATVTSFIDDNLDCPTILDLPHYFYVKQKIEPCNLVFGFMGGEFISGQTVGSQVTFTQFASDLLTSRSIDERAWLYLLDRPISSLRRCMW